MAIQVINNRSLRLYGELMTAMENARLVFEEAGKLVADYDPPPGNETEGIQWRIPTPDQLQGSFKALGDGLVGLKDELKRREKELTSRQWR